MYVYSYNEKVCTVISGLKFYLLEQGALTSAIALRNMLPPFQQPLTAHSQEEWASESFPRPSLVIVDSATVNLWVTSHITSRR